MKHLLLAALLITTSAQAFTPAESQCKTISTKTYCAIPAGMPLTGAHAALLVKNITYAQRPIVHSVSPDLVVIKWYDGNVLSTRYVVTQSTYEGINQ